MNRIESAITETLKYYPDLPKDELITLFVDSIEKDLPQILKAIELPEVTLLSKRKKEFRLRRMKRKYREEQELREEKRIKFIESFHRIQEFYDDAWITTDVYEPNGTEKRIVNSSVESFPLFISASREMGGIFNNGYLDREVITPQLETDTKIGAVVSLENSDKSLLKAPSNLYNVYNIANSLSGGKVQSADFIYDPTYEKMLEIRVNLDAKEAFQLWLVLIDKLEPENAKMLSVKWSGGINLTEDEFVDYAVKIMTKSGVGPKALPGFDAVEAVREGRE